MNLFVTGGTGFLGKALLVRLLELAEFDRIFVLVRPRSNQSAEARLFEMVSRIFPKGRVASAMQRLQAVAGDLTLPGLGIDGKQRDILVKNTQQILHVGASTDFGAPLEESRSYNVEGTLRVLELALDCAAKGSLVRFDYISTAFVAGIKGGEVTEGDLARGQSFANSYEQSKYEAELLVRDFQSKFPIAIYRPSIVVGDSNNGYTPHFKVLYWPLRLLSKNLLPVVPCNRKARLDVVPVDYVCEGIVALMRRQDTCGQTFHLTSGLGNEVRIGDLIDDAVRFSGIRARPELPVWMLRLIERGPLRSVFRDEFWEAVRIGRPYESYLAGKSPAFNSRATETVLQALGIFVPRWENYKKEILSYCRTSHWGRRVPMAEYIYYLPVSGRKVRGESLPA